MGSATRSVTTRKPNSKNTKSSRIPNPAFGWRSATARRRAAIPADHAEHEGVNPRVEHDHLERHGHRVGRGQALPAPEDRRAEDRRRVERPAGDRVQDQEPQRDRRRPQEPCGEPFACRCLRRPRRAAPDASPRPVRSWRPPPKTQAPPRRGAFRHPAKRGREFVLTQGHQRLPLLRRTLRPGRECVKQVCVCAFASRRPPPVAVGTTLDAALAPYREGYACTVSADGPHTGRPVTTRTWRPPFDGTALAL